MDHLGYSVLSDKDDAEEYSVNAKKRQEHFEAETERILMDTYNSLYKCQEFIPMVCNLLACTCELTAQGKHYAMSPGKADLLRQ